MKKLMRRMLSVVAAVAMVLTMAMPVMAATITVENPSSTANYTAYKIFDAKVNSTDTTKVAYTISTINPWFNTVTGKTEDTFANTYTANGLTFTKSGNDENVYTVTVTANSDFSAATFATTLNNALHATTGAVSDTGIRGTVDEDGTVTINTGNDTGYYFIDTTLGSLCSLVTPGTSQKLYEKNSVPSVTDKDVKKDGAADTEYSGAINGNVGDKFNFKVTVNTGTVPSNAYYTDKSSLNNKSGIDTDFVVTDKLGAGFTLATATNAFVVTTDGDTTNWVNGTDYTVSTAAGTGDDEGKTIITITLKSAKLATLAKNKDITIKYDATLNENAIGSGATNEAGTKTTETYTYSFDLKKIDGSTNAALKGVKFTLTDANGNYYKVVSGNTDVDEKVFPDKTERQIETDNDGKITFSGLAAGTYTLTEVSTLDGYNLLTSPLKITVTASADQKTATIAAVDKDNKPVGSISGTELTVENNQGSILPSTGGMGTTIFYVLGAALVIGAGVVLVTRRRLSR